MKNKRKDRKRNDSDSSDSSRSSTKSHGKHKSPLRESKHSKPRHSNDKQYETSKWDSPERANERKRKQERRGSEEESSSKYMKRRDDYRRNSSKDHHSRDRDSNRRYDRRDNRDNRDNRSRNFNSNRRDNRRRRSRSGSFDHSKAVWGKNQYDGDSKNKQENKEKEKPNFGLSGKLTEDTNTYRGVVIKYSEPPEARKPKRRWRLYPFKGEKALQTLYIHRESAYLIGRDRKVVDLPVDHPSCSKQHAALQYRLVPFTREDGTTGKRVRPYLIDLNSANATFINNKKIEPSKYVELLERDVIKFGFSSREYVLLHENSKDEAMDDDVKPEEEDVKNVKEEVD